MYAIRSYYVMVADSVPDNGKAEAGSAPAKFFSGEKWLKQSGLV